MKSKKILINAFSAKLGGGKTYVLNLLDRLPKGDFEILIYLPDDIVLPNDSRVRRMTTSWPTHNPIIRSWWEMLALPFILVQEKVDVLFCPGGVHNTPSSQRYKIATMFRNMLPFDPNIIPGGQSFKEKLRDVLLKRVMLKTMTTADLVIFISDYARKVIESQAKIKSAVTIPHGIANQFYVLDESLSRPSLPFDGEYILYVSRFEFYKRHLEVVQAYEKLPHHIRERYKLLLVGGAEYRAGLRVKDYVKQNGLENEVIFLGDYPYVQLPALYKNARLFVFASTCENCPNILLEAMGSGVPILCSDYQPMPEFGGTAVSYMNPDSPDDIAEKIQTSLLASNNSVQLKSQADKFNWDVTAEKTWDLLLKL
ncbi:MAG: glycosyltransferase family 4 protein [Bdellovibrio sp.]|nr:glycosyltransferase family 4 protein [Bdellovibrio sp.]